MKNRKVLLQNRVQRYLNWKTVLFPHGNLRVMRVWHIKNSYIYCHLS